MERSIRPEARPGYRTRALVALGLTIWTLLQGLTLVVAAVQGGPTEYAVSFVITGILTLYLGGATWVAWAWVRRARPRSYAVAEDPATPHHRSLTGEEDPPTRW